MKLTLDTHTIDACRRDARHIADAIKTELDPYSTVSVERTVLRMLGIDGVDAFDVPYVNVLVDHVKTHGDLRFGIAHHMAWAIARTTKTPQTIAKRVAEGAMSLGDYFEPTTPDYTVLTPFINQSFARIRTQRQHRETVLENHPAPSPEKYVIVATGNIHEDIDQALSAAARGADIIAVIRTTGQSLLDYVPYGATTEGFGGTYATQENFRLMREALDGYQRHHGRYVKLVNYASGLCMPEIAALGALERLDMMLNDSLYGIIFRDINMKRTLIDQAFSRVISGYAGITINTGEDNYLTTTDAFEHAHTVIASQFINERFAEHARMPATLMGLGHAYEIDPSVDNSFLYEIAQAQLSRQLFPDAPLKYMPPTKHMTGDIFKGTVQNALFNIACVTTKQQIHLLGMPTEAIHTPFMSDRALALANADYIYKAFKAFADSVDIKPGSLIEKRAHAVLDNARTLLDDIREEGLFVTLKKGTFAGVSRGENDGKGLGGVFKKHPLYTNPIMERMLAACEEDAS